MKENKLDIKTEGDIKLMVDTFYDKVNKDSMLSYVFNDFSEVNWNTHLPIMYRFWNTLILGDTSYKNSPFEKHLPLPVEKQHFEQWVKLFEQNIDEHFEGDVAENTKLRAKSIAHIFQSKLEFFNKNK